MSQVALNSNQRESLKVFFGKNTELTLILQASPLSRWIVSSSEDYDILENVKNLVVILDCFGLQVSSFSRGAINVVNATRANEIDRVSYHGFFTELVNRLISCNLGVIAKNLTACLKQLRAFQIQFDPSVQLIAPPAKILSDIQFWENLNLLTRAQILELDLFSSHSSNQRSNFDTNSTANATTCAPSKQSIDTCETYYYDEIFAEDKCEQNQPEFTNFNFNNNQQPVRTTEGLAENQPAITAATTTISTQLSQAITMMQEQIQSTVSSNNNNGIQLNNNINKDVFQFGAMESQNSTLKTPKQEHKRDLQTPFFEQSSKENRNDFIEESIKHQNVNDQFISREPFTVIAPQHAGVAQSTQNVLGIAAVPFPQTMQANNGLLEMQNERMIVQTANNNNNNTVSVNQCLPEQSNFHHHQQQQQLNATMSGIIPSFGRDITNIQNNKISNVNQEMSTNYFSNLNQCAFLSTSQMQMEQENQSSFKIPNQQQQQFVPIGNQMQFQQQQFQQIQQVASSNLNSQPQKGRQKQKQAILQKRLEQIKECRIPRNPQESTKSTTANLQTTQQPQYPYQPQNQNYQMHVAPLNVVQPIQPPQVFQQESTANQEYQIRPIQGDYVDLQQQLTPMQIEENMMDLQGQFTSIIPPQSSQLAFPQSQVNNISLAMKIDSILSKNNIGNPMNQTIIHPIKITREQKDNQVITRTANEKLSDFIEQTQKDDRFFVKELQKNPELIANHEQFGIDQSNLISTEIKGQFENRINLAGMIGLQESVHRRNNEGNQVLSFGEELDARVSELDGSEQAFDDLPTKIKPRQSKQGECRNGTMMELVDTVKGNNNRDIFGGKSMGGNQQSLDDVVVSPFDVISYVDGSEMNGITRDHGVGYQFRQLKDQFQLDCQVSPNIERGLTDVRFNNYLEEFKGNRENIFKGLSQGMFSKKVFKRIIKRAERAGMQSSVLEGCLGEFEMKKKKESHGLIRRWISTGAFKMRKLIGRFNEMNYEKKGIVILAVLVSLMHAFF